MDTGPSSAKRAASRRHGCIGLLSLLAVALAAVMMLTTPAGADDRASATVAVTMAEVTVAAPGAQAALAITVAPAAGAPPKSYIRIRGLPAAATLTEGHNVAAGVWAVPLAGLPNLAVRVPKGLTGKADLRASLVTLDGNVLSEARATLVIGPTGLLAPSSAAEAPTGPTGSTSPAAATAGADAAPAHPDSGGGHHGATPDASPVAPSEPLSKTGISSFPPQTGPTRSHSAPPRPAPDLPPSANQARQLLARGIELMSARDVAGARRFFERSADLGLGEAAMRLAATYDPHEVARQRGPAPPPDPKLARKWYERALALGVREAGSRLNRLAAR